MRLAQLAAAWITLTACAAPEDAVPAADTAADDTAADDSGAGDTGTPDDDDTARLSYAADVFRPILEESCAGCHANPGYIHPPISADLTHLVGVGSGADGRGMPYVTPGSLEQSFLWLKVTGRQDEVVEGGTQMPPPDEEPLAVDALAAIEAWILDGAAP